MMLKVGFSEALALQLKLKKFVPPSSSICAPTPTVVVQSKVAAMLDVVVKWIGRPASTRAMVSSNSFYCLLATKSTTWT